MKRYIILLLISVTSFYSCSEESLTLASPNDVTLADLLQTTEGFQQLLIGGYDAYQKIPANEYLLTEVRSDNARVAAEFGSLVTFNDYTITPDNTEAFNYWSNNYKVIFQMNLILDNEANYLALPGASNTVLGEAYFLRALSHFNLVRLFRDVPYIDKVIDASSFTDFPQLDEAVTYEKINADFQRAIQLLEGSTFSNTRANTATATILLAKSLLSQPSPDYVQAQALLLPLASESNEFGFTLTDNYDDIFARGDAGDENNEEIIFKISYQLGGTPILSSSDFDDQVESNAERWSYDMSQLGRSNGSNLATDDLELLMTPTEQPIRFGTTIEEETFLLDRTFNNKWVPDNGEGSSNDWIVLRYADVLLLYAEAAIGDLQDTDNELAIAAFNQVRVRAGLEPLADGESLSRTQLLAERRMEFVFENQRFYDLIRFGVAVDVLTAYSNEAGLFFQANDLYLVTPQKEVDNSNGFFN